MTALNRKMPLDDHRQGVLVDAVLSGLTYPVLALDGDDQFIFVNHAAEEFFKAGQNMLVHTPLGQYLDVDHPVFSMIRRVRSSRFSISDQDLDFNLLGLEPRLVNIQISALPITAQIQSAFGEGCVVIALQERALAERLRGQQQFRGAARSMTSLSALLAHEIKNPLAGIRGAAELLQDIGHHDPKALTELIIAETDRIASLLTRMENFSSGKDIERNPVNIHEVINHCLALAENSFGKFHQVETSFDPSLPEAIGDRDLLIQVLLNLIKNACEASENKSKLFIRTFYNLGARYAVQRRSHDAKSEQSIAPLVIEIEDQGRGISPDLKAHIFDPFVTTKSSGSGLGLALVASAIADHGGTIEVTSQHGQTIFRIGLPIAEI